MIDIKKVKDHILAVANEPVRFEIGVTDKGHLTVFAYKGTRIQKAQEPCGEFFSWYPAGERSMSFVPFTRTSEKKVKEVKKPQKKRLGSPRLWVNSLGEFGKTELGLSYDYIGSSEDELAASQDLTEDEKNIVRKTWQLIERHNTDRFRVFYAKIGGLSLETEFCAPAQDKTFWRRLAKSAKSVGCKIYIYDENRDPPRCDDHRKWVQKAVFTAIPFKAPLIAKKIKEIKKATEWAWEQHGVSVV